MLSGNVRTSVGEDTAYRVVTVRANRDRNGTRSTRRGPVASAVPVIDLLDGVPLPFVLKTLATGFPRYFGTIHLAEADPFI